jgi:hypothetical protein
VNPHVATKGAKEMAEDPWKAHISYLEAEVEKMVERANKLEAMIPDLESDQKKRVLRELVSHLRDSVGEHRKFLALVKQK